MRLLLVLALSSLTLSPLLAQAGPRDRSEARQDHRERVDDAHDTRNDAIDLARLDGIVDAWDAAHAAGDKAAEAAADARLDRWVRQELAENNRDAAEGRREVARSQGEVDASRRERNRSAGSGRPAADDRRDLRDDRRDRADDQRDLAKDRVDRARTRAIAEELDGLSPAFVAGTATAAQYERKRTLLAELKGWAAAELARDKAEEREDRGERREDRRERRE